MLRFPTIHLNVLRTTNPFLAVPMTLLEERAQNWPCIVDQPYVEVGAGAASAPPGQDRVYVGNNDLTAEKNYCRGNGRTATIDFSSDGAAQNSVFNLLRLEERDTGTAGQDGPSLRAAVATASDGTAYAAYFGYRGLTEDAFSGSLIITADVVVTRDDAGGIGGQPFRTLTDPTGGPAGKIVAAGRRIFWGGEIAQQRYGSSLSLAVDPMNSSIVYVAWVDDMPGASQTLRVPVFLLPRAAHSRLSRDGLKLRPDTNEFPTSTPPDDLPGARET